jgi:hypothetical protein
MSGESDERAEPELSDRCPTYSRRKVTVPMVEAHPATVVSGHARGLPLRTIDDPDAALVERWQSGDEAAFETLVRRHERRVF